MLTAAPALVSASQNKQLIENALFCSILPARLPYLSSGRYCRQTGALGVAFPMTGTRQAAEAAVRAVRYPPVGDRYWGPFYAPPRWGLSMPEYLDVADDEVLAMGTIEHIDAVRTIREVVAMPGLDVLFIGPGDLATSMGLRGRADHADVQAAMKTLEEAILASPVILGGVAHTPEQANMMIARGYRALVVGLDWSLLQRGITAAIDGVKR
jgi:4-hydroxy-2-oxoheptanedioate aldolase